MFELQEIILYIRISRFFYLLFFLYFFILVYF